MTVACMLHACAQHAHENLDSLGDILAHTSFCQLGFWQLAVVELLALQPAADPLARHCSTSRSLTGAGLQAVGAGQEEPGLPGDSLQKTC